MMRILHWIRNKIGKREVILNVGERNKSVKKRGIIRFARILNRKKMKYEYCEKQVYHR